MKEKIVCTECLEIACISVSGRNERFMLASGISGRHRTRGNVNRCPVRRDHERARVNHTRRQPRSVEISP